VLPSGSDSSVGNDERFNRAVLLIEFEILNEAFHTVGDAAFKKLSFLRTDDLEKWSRFDAALIEPAEKTFTFFEAKLTSDISRTTVDFPWLNQVMRNLAAAYLLTEHEDSLYNDWDFRYIIVLPEKDLAYISSYCASMLNSLEAHVDAFRHVITQEYADQLDNDTIGYLDPFMADAPSRISTVTWAKLADAITAERPAFFIDYLQHIGEIGTDAARAVRDRFALAGIGA
jgi:hypothetical protein